MKNPILREHIDEKIIPTTFDFVYKLEKTIRFLENELAFGYFLAKKSKCVLNNFLPLMAH